MIGPQRAWAAWMSHRVSLVVLVGVGCAAGYLCARRSDPRAAPSVATTRVAESAAEEGNPVVPAVESVKPVPRGPPAASLRSPPVVLTDELGEILTTCEDRATLVQQLALLGPEKLVDCVDLLLDQLDLGSESPWEWDTHGARAVAALELILTLLHNPEVCDHPEWLKRIGKAPGSRMTASILERFVDLHPDAQTVLGVVMAREAWVGQEHERLLSDLLETRPLPAGVDGLITSFTSVAKADASFAEFLLAFFPDQEMLFRPALRAVLEQEDEATVVARIAEVVGETDIARRRQAVEVIPSAFRDRPAAGARILTNMALEESQRRDTASLDLLHFYRALRELNFEVPADEIWLQIEYLLREGGDEVLRTYIGSLSSKDLPELRRVVLEDPRFSANVRAAAIMVVAQTDHSDAVGYEIVRMLDSESGLALTQAVAAARNLANRMRGTAVEPRYQDRLEASLLAIVDGTNRPEHLRRDAARALRPLLDESERSVLARRPYPGSVRAVLE